MNDYEFWEKYNKKIKNEIERLCKTKKELYIDLHIHSNYSADGKQSLKQILENSKEKKFDIIAITDHDTLNFYDELYDILSNGITYPIIIPGIEFTIDNKEYGNQCHMLQLFINPKDTVILKDVSKNYNSMFNRSKIQFNRLKENITINEIIKRNDIYISYNDYEIYLKNNNYIPEYDTLSFYLIEKFKEKGVTTFDILDLLEKNNNLDPYDDRRIYKENRYKKLKEKYLKNELNNYNARFLLLMLAVREVDDDWWPKPSCGSLSVNSYGQLKIEELNDKYDTYFAHPTEKSLNVVDKIVKSKKNIKGMELNIRNHYEDINNFYKVLNDNKLNLIKGSDSHDASLEFYENMEYYKIKTEELIKIIK